MSSLTNYESIVEYKDQWYAFYHNSTISGNDWLSYMCGNIVLYS
ncbi:hypothetical protein [uncultured Bacteroides sp.]|nr:hypothetical protein [uncultured Bacteroides sp.]